MKLLIAGSRSINDFDLSPYIPDNTDVIISGGAGGVDTIAEKYADKHRISKYIIRPQYNLYGKGAPLKRNEEMIKMADKILVIWDGVSKGAAYTAKYAQKLGKEITIINVN